ncbi:MAG TPA: PKD domain-containing protein, partial [Ferruginibacter sp.]|nr:PKD domain-containing protein [Ferruginibacter sp.]
LGLSYAAAIPISSWHWDFGDGGTANTQNTTHNFAWSGNYLVKLIITTSNGCTDSFTKNVQFIKLDSVRFNSNQVSCFKFDFAGLAYSPSDVINSWQWDFGDGGNANTQNASHTYGAAGSYTVKLVVTDANGCKDSIQNIVSPGTYPADAGVDTAICSNGTVSVTLHGMPNGAASYSWSPAIYLNNPNAQNPVATISTTTKFYLQTADALGCSGRDSITVTINPVPSINTLTDTAVCRGTVLILTTNGPGGLSYHWSPGTYVSDSTISNPRYVDNNSQTLYVTGTNSFGCAGKDTINVTIKALPVVRTIPDSTVCTNQSITLTTTGASSYSWSPVNQLSDPNIANPVFSGNSSQTYYVTGTGANGCKAKDTINITVLTPGSFLAPPDKSTCNGTGVVLNGNNGSSVTYLWSPSTYLSNPNIINPVASPPSTFIYNLLVKETRCGYDSNFNVVVTVNPLPVINAGKSNDLDCSRRSATLHASGGNQYLWTPSNSLNDNTSPNPIATPLTTTLYYVKVTTDKGCVGDDSVTVFNKSGLNIVDYMPNAFTPDRNGLNDCFGLKYTAGIRDFQFMIYDRWGEVIFMTNVPTMCWDGTYKGKPSLAGTYVYYMKASNACGTSETQGAFQLIR